MPNKDPSSLTARLLDGIPEAILAEKILQGELMPKVFRFTYAIRLDDLDFMGIVGNANWLVFMERSRTDLLAALDYPMQRMFAEKLGGVVAELKVKYLRSARLSDVITMQLTAKEPSESSCTLEYVAESSEGKTFIKAETRMTFIDESGRPTAIPPSILHSLFSEEN
jgi:YbgC/YbaW family acyl-CoA thioester hydrolase